MSLFFIMDNERILPPSTLLASLPRCNPNRQGNNAHGTGGAHEDARPFERQRAVADARIRHDVFAVFDAFGFLGHTFHLTTPSFYHNKLTETTPALNPSICATLPPTVVHPLLHRHAPGGGNFGEGDHAPISRFVLYVFLSLLYNSFGFTNSNEITDKDTNHAS
jgi:hypothetical protein